MMKRSSTLNLSRLVLLASCALAWAGGMPALADVPRPRPAPEPSLPKDDGLVEKKHEAPLAARGTKGLLVLRNDGTGKEARLMIPQATLAALQQAAQPHAPAPPEARARLTPTQTVMAGLALSAALTVGGLKLARGRRGIGAPLAALAFAGVIGAVALASWADIAIPRDGPVRPADRNPPPRPPVAVPGAQGAGGALIPVVIEVTREGSIELILPKNEPAAEAPAAPPADARAKP